MLHTDKLIAHLQSIIDDFKKVAKGMDEEGQDPSESFPFHQRAEDFENLIVEIKKGTFNVFL